MYFVLLQIGELVKVLLKGELSTIVPHKFKVFRQSIITFYTFPYFICAFQLISNTQYSQIIYERFLILMLFQFWVTKMSNFQLELVGNLS